MAVGKFQMLRQQAYWNSNRSARGNISSAVSSKSLSLVVRCDRPLGCSYSLLQQQSCRRPCGREQLRACQLHYTSSQRWKNQGTQPGHCGCCYGFRMANTPLKPQQRISDPQQQRSLQTLPRHACTTQRQTAILAGMLHSCRATGRLVRSRACRGTACGLGGHSASSLDSSTNWLCSSSLSSSTRMTRSPTGASRSNSSAGARSRRKHSGTFVTNSGISGGSSRSSSSYSSINQKEKYPLRPLFSSSSISRSGPLTGNVRVSLSAPALVHTKQQATRSLPSCEAGFSSCGTAGAARQTAGPSTGIQAEGLDVRRVRQTRDGSGDERRKRETALLQLILPRRLRLAFPYVVPAFRPLVLLAGLPMEQQILSERSNALRLAAARRGHALLPPFSPQTEELWCLYTQLMLTDPAVVLRQQLAMIREREKDSERGTEATAHAGPRQYVSEGLKDRSGASFFPTASSEASTEQYNEADRATEANRDTGSAAIDLSRGDGRAASGGRKATAERGSKPRSVRINVLLGELLAQLLATRNVTLQAPWRLLFAAVERSLQRLQQQQQQPRATGISDESERTTTSTCTKSSGSAAKGNDSSSEDSEATRHFLEVVLRLRTAASRVRYDWKWGVRQIEEAARKDFPLLDKDCALRVLHALSSSKVDDRLCERLADAFVFLWRSDYAEATRLQPTEGLLLLEIFSQRKQLLQALPDPYFFKHICSFLYSPGSSTHAYRRLHSYIHLGLLTPLEKTRLAIVYKDLRTPHFTFFSHIAAEVLHQQQKRQALIAAGQTSGGTTLPTADELQQQQHNARRWRLVTLQRQLLRPPAAAVATAGRDAATSAAGWKVEVDREEGEPHIRATRTARESLITAALAAGEKEWKYLEYSRRDYVMGCGVPADFIPSDVMLEHPLLPLLTTHTVKRLCRGEFGCHHERCSTSGRDPAGEVREKDAKLVDDAETFERTDLPQYERARTTTAAPSAATAVPSLTGSSAADRETTGSLALEGIREYTAGQIAVIADAMLFLNMHNETRFADAVIAAVGGRFSGEHTLVHSLDPQQALVKWTTRKVIERHERKPQWKQRRNSYISLEWLHAPAPDDRLVSENDPLTSAESLLLVLCKHVCKRVHSFSMRELTRMLRAIAYLNFSEKSFFRTFSSFCMQRLGEMEEEDIANMTQAFNRAGVEDPYLFSMMGKRYQQLQANLMAIKHRGVLVRRIG